MIFYHIQATGDVDYVATLIGWIYHPDNFYRIAVDTAVPAEQCAALEALQRAGNVAVSRDIALTWGGASPVNALLLGMRSFIAGPPSLSYFINLSEADFPLKTQKEIFNVLSPGAGEKPTAWMDSFLCRPEYFIENATPANLYRSIRPRPEIEFLIDSRIAALIAEREESAIIHPHRRPGFMLQEVVGERLHIARPLLDAEHRARLALFAATGYRVGRGWHVFNREFCKVLLDSGPLYTSYQILSGTLLPEESLFQTVLAMLPGDIVHHNGNFRFRGGGPENLRDALLSELETSDAFFAGELNRYDCCALIEWAHRRFASSTRMLAAAAGLPPDLPLVGQADADAAAGATG